MLDMTQLGLLGHKTSTQSISVHMHSLVNTLNVCKRHYVDSCIIHDYEIEFHLKLHVSVTDIAFFVIPCEQTR